MTTQVRSVSVRLSMDNARYVAAAKQSAQVTEHSARQIERSYGRASNNTVASLRRISTGLVGIGVGKIVTDSVRLEATYGKTMALVQAQTGASASKVAELDRLAIKMGQDTVYSANDAARAMLELTKGGLTPAQVQAGALDQTLQLATAGEIELASAANTVVGVMGAFQLGADQTASAVAALAGAANASSADVGQIAQALAQVGPSAYAAGLSVQETTALLAAFANEGLRGSDAGTSLKTFLQNLTPATKKQRDAMRELNLEFVDQNGNYVDAVEMAARLQKAIKGRSDSERSMYLTTIFGSDAQRAANILVNEGADAIRKYQRETSDLTSTQKLADAAMSGTAGALERLKGNIETAEFRLGRGLAPTVQRLAEELGELLQEQDLKKWGRSIGSGLESALETAKPFAEAVLPVLNDGLHTLGDVLRTVGPLARDLASAFESLPDDVQKAALLAAGVGVLARRFRGTTGGGGALGGAASFANPTPVFVVNMGAVGAGGGLLGGGPGKVGKVSRIPKLASRGASLAAIASVLTLMATGKDEEWGLTGTTNGAAIGGTLFGGPGALIGGSIGALSDTYHAGDQTKSVIDRAELAGASNDLHQVRASLASVREEAMRLSKGGWETNFARGVDYLTGRREKLQQVGAELAGILSTAESMEGLDGIDVLLGTRKPMAPGNRRPPRLPIERTPPWMIGAKPFPLAPPAADSTDPGTVLALSGLPGPTSPKLPPSDVSAIGSDTSEPGLAKWTVSLTMNSDQFDSEAERARAEARLLNRLFVEPRLGLDTSEFDTNLDRARRRFEDLAGDLGPLLTGSLFGIGGTGSTDGRPSNTTNPAASTDAGRVAGAMERNFRGYGEGGTATVAPAGRWSSGGGDIDYDRIAVAVSGIRPLAGHMTVMPHDYNDWVRKEAAMRESGALAGEQSW